MFDLNIKQGDIYCSVHLFKKSHEVFDFFSNPKNLEILIPDFLKFRISSEFSEEIKQWDEIEYRLTLRYIPIKWRSHISVREPNKKFIDEQLIGPYKK